MEPIMRYINRVYRCSILCRNNRLEAEGLNGFQHTYIVHICMNPGISQDQLARKIYVNKSNVTRQLSLLEQAGFIYRVPCETDKRVMQVYPTKKGMEIFPKVREAADDWCGYLLDGFTEEEKGQLRTLLERAANRAMEQADKERG